jgi:hypothetical protein
MQGFANLELVFRSFKGDDLKADQLKPRIAQYLSQHPLAVVATQGKKGPEAALVAFAETSELELVFQTFADSRKYANLCADGRVAFVIGWDAERHVTVQYEGIAREQTGTAARHYQSVLRSKETPCSDQFVFHEKSRLFVVTPTWIGYSDYTTQPPDVQELFFNQAFS